MSKIKDRLFLLARKIFDKVYYAPISINGNVVTGRISGLKNVTMEGKCRLQHGCNFAGKINVGKYTTFGYYNLIHGNIEIGRYCQIGADVMINSTNHPVNYLSTYINYNLFKGDLYKLRTVDQIKIGHDVWIGHGAIVLGNVTIGNGAIIAAGAVVTKDVRPYSIVGGIPSKELKRRFSDQVCNEIDELQWWNLSDEELQTKKHLFFNNLELAKTIYQ